MTTTLLCDLHQPAAGMQRYDTASVPDSRAAHRAVSLRFQWTDSADGAARQIMGLTAGSRACLSGGPFHDVPRATRSEGIQESVGSQSVGRASSPHFHGCMASVLVPTTLHVWLASPRHRQSSPEQRSISLGHCATITAVHNPF
jgi:hypothetical protein